MLFLIMVLLIGVAIVLWNFDLHRAVVLKMKVRDAGDAAALASARWQGISLNTIGELNLIQAALVTEYASGGVHPTEYYAALSGFLDLQSRMINGGPAVAFAAAQQAAFNNGIHSYAGYHFYVIGTSDYAEFLRSIVRNGIAAQLVNSRASDHPLMDPNFYDAISAGYRDNWWCLFYQYPDLMTHLTSYTTPEDYWPEKTKDFYDLPYLQVYFWPNGDTNNTYYGSIDDLFGTGTVSGDQGGLQDAIDRATENSDLEGQIDVDLMQYFTWYPALYSQVSWRPSWQDYIDEHELPFRADVDRRYDYMGPQNIYQLHITYPLLSPGRGGDSTDWVSAAKVFGYLEGGGDGPVPPNQYGIVLPAFRDARLIPVPPNVRDPDLEEHYNRHVDDYLSSGISALDENGDGRADNGCRYCQLLIYFDDDAFRQRGIDWLAEHQGECNDNGIAPGDDSVNDIGETGPPYGH